MKDWKTTVVGVLTAFFYLITVAFGIPIPADVQNAIIVLAIFLMFQSLFCWKRRENVGSLIMFVLRVEFQSLFCWKRRENRDRVHRGAGPAHVGFNPCFAGRGVKTI